MQGLEDVFKMFEYVLTGISASNRFHSLTFAVTTKVSDLKARGSFLFIHFMSRWLKGRIQNLIQRRYLDTLQAKHAEQTIKVFKIGGTLEDTGKVPTRSKTPFVLSTQSRSLQPKKNEITLQSPKLRESRE